MDGPRGVTVKLMDEEILVQETVTANEGRYDLIPCTCRTWYETTDMQ